MLGIILFLLLALTLSFVFCGVFCFFFRNKIEMKKRIDQFAPAFLETKEKKSVKNLRVFQFAKAKIQSQIAGKLNKEKETALKTLLTEAGNPFDLTPVDFRMYQILISSAVFLFMLFAFLPQTDKALQAVVFSLAAGAFGYLYPIFYLKAKKKQKTLLIEKMMPDFFDMVNVSIEAGLGLDGALAKVSKQMKGPLSDEFARTLEDIRLGTSKKAAFQQLASRVPSDQFTSVINALIQADQMGIGMSKVLRAQTTRIREQRRQQVKEQAMKAPIKMMFPMILFIFPTLFVVLMGPIIIKMVTEWM